MPTPRRFWYPGAIYHVVSRGVRRSPIFLESRDFEKFMEILDDTLLYSPFNIHAYCLMTNHYHLLIGTKEHPLKKIMHCINGSYATWFNRKYNLSGHVFESRYSSHPVPSDYGLMAVSAYIHNNPRGGKICTNPLHYPWSSFYHYAVPDIIAEHFSVLHPKNKKISSSNLFLLHPDTAQWNSLPHGNMHPRSPPKAFTRERIRQLFPTPLHLHYPDFVEREWKLTCLQRSTNNNLTNEE